MGGFLRERVVDILCFYCLIVVVFVGYFRERKKTQRRGEDNKIKGGEAFRNVKKSQRGEVISTSLMKLKQYKDFVHTPF